MALPLPDGSRTLRFRREECSSGLAITCGRDGGEAMTSVAPSAFPVPLRVTGFSRPPGRFSDFGLSQ